MDEAWTLIQNTWIEPRQTDFVFSSVHFDFEHINGLVQKDLTPVCCMLAMKLNLSYINMICQAEPCACPHEIIISVSCYSKLPCWPFTCTAKKGPKSCGIANKILITVFADFAESNNLTHWGQGTHLCTAANFWTFENENAQWQGAHSHVTFLPAVWLFCSQRCDFALRWGVYILCRMSTGCVYYFQTMDFFQSKANRE